MANGDDPFDNISLTLALDKLTASVNKLTEKMDDKSGVGKGIEAAASRTTDQKIDDIFESAVVGIGKELESVGDVWVTTLENAFSPFAQISQGLTKTIAIMARSTEAENAAIEAVEKDLADSLAKLGVDFEKYKETEEGKAKLEEVREKERQRVRRQADRDFLERFGGLVTVPIAAFTNYLMGIFTKSNDMMQGSLKFNKTFTEAVQGAGDKIAAVPGDMADKMATLFAFEERGLSQVGSASFALAGRMQKTGQSVSNLIGIQQKLMMVGGLSLRENENLAKVLLSTSIANQVSTDSYLMV